MALTQTTNKPASQTNLAVIGNQQTVRTLMQRQDIINSLDAIRNRCMSIENIREQAILAVQEKPELLKCNPVSFLSAVRYSAQLGLPFAGPGAKCHLIAFGNRVTPIVNVQGKASLSRRTGQVRRIEARCVYQNDEFKIIYGSDPSIIHYPCVDGARGNVIGAYATALYRDGFSQFEFMPVDEIEKCREKSKNAHRGPWVENYPEMCRKTAIHRLCKYLPSLSDIDENVQAGIDFGEYEDEQPQPKSITSTQIDGNELNNQVDPLTGEILTDDSQLKEQLLNQIRDVLINRWPGNSSKAKNQKLTEIQNIFGVKKWSEVTLLDGDLLAAGLDEIQRRASDVPGLDDDPLDDQQVGDDDHPQNESDLAERKAAVINQILSALPQGNSLKNEAQRLRLCKSTFGTTVIDEIATLPLPVLQAGLRTLTDGADNE